MKRREKSKGRTKLAAVSAKLGDVLAALVGLLAAYFLEARESGKSLDLLLL
ncbi:hypothetical protein L914_10445 [Phytophthora nicotianae]|uniref:Uncharacterized protein n=1 Tax=Phytophthora nicotianae TaxID=4792 RepID=W2N6L8_PHYNI|nr:hypothetical protein L914_10445 [Phytophthora nicotianae]